MTEFFVMQLAGVSIGIHHHFPYIRQLCREYMTDERTPAFSVAVAPEELDEARKQEPYPVDYLEGLCIMKKVVMGLIPYGVLMVHSAVVAVDGMAYVFAAHSGVGKTTHIRLWLKAFGDRAIVVNGDKPLFQFGAGGDIGSDEGDILYACGSPWCGKEGMGKNLIVPVAGICLLERSETNEIRPAKKREIVRRFLDQVVIPSNRQAQMQTMMLLDRIFQSVPFFTLGCNQSPEAAIVAYEGMKRKQKI